MKIKLTHQMKVTLLEAISKGVLDTSLIKEIEPLKHMSDEELETKIEELKRKLYED